MSLKPGLTRRPAERPPNRSLSRCRPLSSRPIPTSETEERVGINIQVRLKPCSKGAEVLVCKSQVGFGIRKVKKKKTRRFSKSLPLSTKDSGVKAEDIVARLNIIKDSKSAKLGCYRDEEVVRPLGTCEVSSLRAARCIRHQEVVPFGSMTPEVLRGGTL